MSIIQIGLIPVFSVAETFYVLKEDGDAILSETGDIILTEAAV